MFCAGANWNYRSENGMRMNFVKNELQYRCTISRQNSILIISFNEKTKVKFYLLIFMNHYYSFWNFSNIFFAFYFLFRIFIFFSLYLNAIIALKQIIIVAQKFDFPWLSWKRRQLLYSVASALMIVATR